MEDNSNECPICLIDLDISNKTILTFDCGHKVHLYCINEWKNNSKKAHSDFYTCLECNEYKDIINIENPIVNIPRHHEIDNSCRGFFSAVGSFLRSLF